MQQREFVIGLPVQLLIILILVVEWFSLTLIGRDSINTVSYSLFLIKPGTHSLLLRLLFILLPILAGLAFNEILKGFKVVPRRSYYVLILWMSILIQFPAIGLANLHIISLMIILFGFFLLFNLTFHNLEKRNLVSISFVFALASFFYLPLILNLIFIPVSIAILRNFNFRFLIISLISFIVPFLYLLVFYFFFDHLDDFFLMVNQIINPFKNFNLNLPLSTLVSSGFLAVILLIALIFVLPVVNTMLIQIRRIFFIMTFFLLLAVTILFLFPADFDMNFLWLIPTLSIIFTLFIFEMRNRRLFYILIILLAAIPIVKFLL